MINYKYTLNDVDIKNEILNFTYSENLEDVASPFKFEYIVKTDASIPQKPIPDIGSILKVYDQNQTQPFYVGIVTDLEHTNDVNKYSYSGFDVGFYLNKNEVIKQFKKETNIRQAITELCKEYQINLSYIPNFKATVKKIYKDTIFADIIKDMLNIEKSKGGLRDLYIDCKNGNLSINRYQIEQNLTTIIGNGFLVNYDETYSNIKTKKSFQELKNRVLISDNKEKNIKYVEEKNDASIRTYGLLTAVETVDSSKKVSYKKLANDKLQELNKIKEEISLSLLSDYKISKGKLIDFTISDYGLTGVYLVTSATHTIDNTKEVVDVSIAKYER